MPTLLRRREEVRALKLASSQPESLPELNELVETLKKRVVDIALEDPGVRERLAGTRHRVLTVDYREDKGEAGKAIRIGEVGIYDYDRDVLVVVAVQARTGSVSKPYDREGSSPPISDEERGDAIRLVASRPGVGQTFRRKRSQVVAFPTPTYAFDAEPQRRGHRGCTLYVPVGRGGVAAATVDLSAREVVPDDLLPDVLRSPRARRRPSSRGA